MRIKAIATDFDWTLTNRKGIVSPKAVEAVRGAECLGIPVIIATARTLINIQEEIRKSNLKISGPIIAENGGVIKDQRTGKEIILGSLEKAEKAYNVIRRRVKGLKRLPLNGLPRHLIRQTDIVLLVQKKKQEKTVEATRQVIFENKLDEI
jgi:hydroxymethylpyrimidine pyrophosphatase-like HAD family hydrolase